MLIFFTIVHVHLSSQQWICDKNKLVVAQFWKSKKPVEVEKSRKKIGSKVTQDETLRMTTIDSLTLLCPLQSPSSQKQGS